ncbi:MAG: carbamoyltransferase HypF [Gemmataceae bacterium]
MSQTTSRGDTDGKPLVPPDRTAARIVVHGQVQGVGFRPFVYRLAQLCELGGSVRNGPEGVAIEIEGRPEDVARFCERLAVEAPTNARIDRLSVEPTLLSGRSSFTIDDSDASPCAGARVPRDLGTCAECRSEVFAASDRRRNYAFTNCTACGPRYSIVEAMPYDRSLTTMRDFALCRACDIECHSVSNRRFHAQTNACSACGPQVALMDAHRRVVAGQDDAVVAAASMLRQGRIVAIKGLGGFQLLVRADQPEAVQRLRLRKHRPSKPLAVMVPSLGIAERLAALEPVERELLTSPPNPIVLANSPSTSLASTVAPRAGTIGLLLPTTPLHHLLLAQLGVPVVATSGNRNDEPLATDDMDAMHRLAEIADVFLIHNRPIRRPVDDSVVRSIAGQPVTFRLARGHAPLPLPALEGVDLPPSLATGGHQKTSLAFWTGTQAVLAQHIGDMDRPSTRRAFETATRDLSDLYQFEPTTLACDQHPDYFTSQWAAAQGKPIIAVQHHCAHALACMVEHNLLDREVLAFVWDGTGYGPDGTIWGGECLRVRNDRTERVASLLPFPLPGGEAAIRHPNRIAFGLLHSLLGEDALLRDGYWIKRLRITSTEGRLLASAVRHRVCTPWTSSMGRLFDAVAALLFSVEEVTYEGEAAVWLESAADTQITSAYDLPLRDPDASRKASGDCSCARGDWRPLLTAILGDLANEVDLGRIAARFHNTLASWAAEVASQHPYTDIVLSGGCFQNRLLSTRMKESLSAMNRRVYSHGCVPPNDGGLAVGQLAHALMRNSRDVGRQVDALGGATCAWVSPAK